MLSEEAKTKQKKKIFKLIFEIVFFATLLILAFIYVIQDDPTKTFSILASVDIFPLSMAILCILISLVLDGIVITSLAHMYNGKYHFYQGFLNVCIGQTIGVFIKSGSSILQAYTFTKQDIKSAHAASIITMNYLLGQISLFIYSLVMLIFGYSYVKDVPIHLLGSLPLYVICIIGIIIQFFILLIIFSLAFWRSMHRFVLTSLINTLYKLHIIKNPDKVRDKLTLQFATYRVEMKRLLHNKKLMLSLLLINIVKRIILAIVPFLCFLSIGVNGEQLNFMQSLFSIGYVDIISSLINVGAPEIMFQSTFSYFLSNLDNASSIVSACNLLWRSLTFYLLFVIGLLTLIFYRGSPKRHELLSNTCTIYDLEISNIQSADIHTQNYLKDVNVSYEGRRAPLLSKEEVSLSFEKLKRNISKDEYTEKRDDELDKILQEQRLRLAEIEHTVSNSLKADKEILKEANEDKEKIELTVSKRYQKKHDDFIKKQEKEIEKAKKKMLKKQPHGTIIKEDENKDITFISSDEIIEIRSPEVDFKDEKD